MPHWHYYAWRAPLASDSERADAAALKHAWSGVYRIQPRWLGLLWEAVPAGRSRRLLRARTPERLAGKIAGAR